MATPRATAILPCVVTGATWDGFSLSLSSDGTSLADGLASATLTLYDSAGVSALALASPAGITVTNAATWAITVLPITPIGLAAGTYTGSLKMTSTTGDVRKWIRIQLPVLAE